MPDFVDPSQLEKTLSDGVTKVCTVKKIWPCHKTPVFRMEFGLTVCPLNRLLGIRGAAVDFKSFYYLKANSKPMYKKTSLQQQHRGIYS